MVRICWIFYGLAIIYSVTSEISNQIIDCNWYDTSKLQFQCGWAIVANSGPFFGGNNSIRCDGGKRIQNKSSFDSIEFHRCRFSVFLVNIFERYCNIRKMDLSRVGLESLRWQNFIYADHLKILDISNNRLSEISAILFDRAPELNRANFSNNQISFIDPRAFDHSTADQPSKLATLDLSHNKIDLIDSQTFAAMSTLKTLNLSFNHIHVIDADLLEYNKELEVLELRFNRMTAFVCKGFEHLNQLDLSHNFLKEIDGSCFRTGRYMGLNIENNIYLMDTMNNQPATEPTKLVLFIFGLVVLSILSILCILLAAKKIVLPWLCHQTVPFLTLTNADDNI